MMGKQAQRMILEDARQKKKGEDKRRLGKNEMITKQEKSRCGGKGGQNKIQILPFYDAD